MQCYKICLSVIAIFTTEKDLSEVFGFVYGLITPPVCVAEQKMFLKI